MEKRRISILGDSISTFAGYTPEEAVFYDSYVQWETGVKSVEDTWWMQVIKALDGELGTNHSLVGSMVSGNLSTSAMSYERIEKLGTNGIPDIILISAGCNDWGFCVLPEEFEEAYRTMLHRIKEQYPHADIYCATLPEGKQPQGRHFLILTARFLRECILILSERMPKKRKYILRILQMFRKNMKQWMECIRIKQECIRLPGCGSGK